MYSESDDGRGAVSRLGRLRAQTGSASFYILEQGMPSRAGRPCLMNWTIDDFLLHVWFTLAFIFLCIN